MLRSYRRAPSKSHGAQIIDLSTPPPQPIKIVKREREELVPPLKAKKKRKKEQDPCRRPIDIRIFVEVRLPEETVKIFEDLLATLPKLEGWRRTRLSFHRLSCFPVRISRDLERALLIPALLPKKMVKYVCGVVERVATQSAATSLALDGFDHYIDNLNKGSEEVLTLSVHEPRPLIMLAQSLDASLQDLMLRPPHLRQRSLTDFPYHLAFARRPEGQRHISIGKLQRWTQEYEQQLLRSPGRTVRIGVETPEYRDSWPLAAAASVV